MQKRRVVITGMGVVAPGAGNLSEFNQLLREGRSAVEFRQELADLGFECQVAAVADPEINCESLAIRYFEILSTNETIKLAAKAALEAWTNAGFAIPDPEDENVDYNTGVVIGSVAPGMSTISKRVVPLTNSGKIKRLGSNIIENIMPSGPAAYINALLNVGNHSIAVSSACSTGTDSILSGYSSVVMGFVDRMVVGASEAYSPYTLAGFDSMRVMNRHSNHDPTRASSPLGKITDGFVPGSGAAVMVLESLEHAQARGAKIYAEILGGAVSCGAMRSGGSITFPNRNGVIHCLKLAMQFSGIGTADVDYINGHLSGTVADALEVKNWADVLGRFYPDFPYINSTKSLIGHCQGASGALEAVATVLQLKHGYVHASLNTEELHPKVARVAGRNAVPLKTIDFPDMKIAAKASFGFGDVNSALIFKKWE